MFDSILNSADMVSYNGGDILLCSAVSLLIGAVIALVFHVTGNSSPGYKTSLVILPVLVQSVIMMVNGNLGTSVAVLGAFSLVRFRSQPGNSREICGVFFAMAAGLATAMGCVAFACALTLTVGIILIISEMLLKKMGSGEKMLRISIPENLDYTDVFDDIFARYTNKHTLLNVRSTNMGSMFELRYKIRLKTDTVEKQMIDELRCKNGNLTVMCGREELNNESL